MPTPFRSFSLLALCSVAVPALVGCGGSDAPQLADAGGIVFFKGKPVASANVLFVPEKGPVAVGITNEQGVFNLTTKNGKGAPVGNHQVAISLFEETGEVADNDAPEAKQSPRPKPLIPTKYTSHLTSGLKATVSTDAAANDFAFDLAE